MKAETLLASAERFTEILSAENAALTALDFSGTGALMSAKEDALKAMTVALSLPDGPVDASLRQRIEAFDEQLSRLMDENRRLLERALVVQTRVVGVIARASRCELARQARGYSTNGAPATASRAPAIALAARA
jgi:hypothetical protein